MERIAVIYDDQPRPETTGLYCRRAMGELVREGPLKSVEHLLPSELERVSPGQFDLYLYIDDGTQQIFRDDLRPAAWWGIDSHLDFERCLKMSSLCDFTFAAQKDGAEQLQQEGMKNAQWLPLACDPQIHGRVQTNKQFDVAFVGHIFPGERQELLEQIAARYPNSFIGQQNFLKMAETYSASRVVFNRSIRNDINMRVFEGLCSGSLLLTNDLSANGPAELIQEGVHYASYSDTAELFDKLVYYLNHDEVRERIAGAGRQHVLQHHTYRHRMETLLRSVQQQLTASPTSISVNQPDPQPPIPQKEAFYFEFDRPDVQSLVPISAKRILDIGCGGGRMGEALKQRQNCEVIGIERDPIATERAEDLFTDNWSVVER
ncbi:glycosyltransferase family protein [Thalassoglobus sp.]|uniref:glycosyltransferase family protein n=1 Tax=Thalassoglobus sp. TaxID=2795869 RepID=UPI003AA96ABC